MELYITAEKYCLRGLRDCAQECFTKKSVGFKMLDEKEKEIARILVHYVFGSATTGAFSDKYKNRVSGYLFVASMHK
jgi:hypothetical protein